MKREADTLSFEPCIPNEWESFTIHYRYKETAYRIRFIQKSGVTDTKKITLDGVELPSNRVLLIDDQREHTIELLIPVRQAVTI